MEKQEILELTYRYSDAFNSRNLIVMESFFAPEATLIDPQNLAVGKESIMEVIKQIYDKNQVLTFFATKIIVVEELFSVIEFNLEIGSNGNVTHLRGTDHITWNKEGKIVLLEAFLYEKS